MKLFLSALLVIIDTLESSLIIANGEGRIFSYTNESRREIAKFLREELSKKFVEITIDE